MKYFLKPESVKQAPRSPELVVAMTALQRAVIATANSLAVRTDVLMSLAQKHAPKLGAIEAVVHLTKAIEAFNAEFTECQAAVDQLNASQIAAAMPLRQSAIAVDEILKAKIVLCDALVASNTKNQTAQREALMEAGIDEPQASAIAAAKHDGLALKAAADAEQARQERGAIELFLNTNNSEGLPQSVRDYVAVAPCRHDYSNFVYGVSA